MTCKGQLDAQVQSHQIQIRSDPLRFTTRSRLDLLRLTQIYPDWFNAVLISLDLLSLTQIQVNSDTLRSTHSRSDSLRLTQMFSDCFNVLRFLLISLISDRFTDPRGKREGSPREKGKREEGFASLPSPVLTRQPDRAYARTNETKRNDFPVGSLPPTSDNLQ